MANLVVYAELAEDRQPTQSARFALAQARLISRALGATVYAVVAHHRLEGGELDEIAESLGHAGADRVLLWPNVAARSLPLYASLGPFLEAVARQLRPRMWLFPAGAAAVQVAPVLAARLEAEFFARAEVTLADAHLAMGCPGRLRLHRVAGNALEEFDVIDAERMVVCTLANANAVAVCGGQAAELEVMDLPAQPNVVVNRTVVVPNPCETPLMALGEGNDTTTAHDARLLFGMVCPKQVLLFTDNFQAWLPLPLVMAPGSNFGLAGNQAMPKEPQGVTTHWRTAAESALTTWRSTLGPK